MSLISRLAARRLASHADIADLAAGVFLGVDSGLTHELVPLDPRHRPQRQVHWLGVDHLQDDVLSVTERQGAIVLLGEAQEVVVGPV